MTETLRPRLRDFRNVDDMLHLSQPYSGPPHVIDPVIAAFIARPGYVPNPEGHDGDSLTEGWSSCDCGNVPPDCVSRCKVN